MLELSIALVIIAGMACWLVNKHLDLKHSINSRASDDAATAAVESLTAKFDARINKAFENHQVLRTELDSIKLAVGFRNKQP